MNAPRARSKRTPLLRPTTIPQLLKAVRKGHVMLREPTRLEKLRYKLREPKGGEA
jgi:hypothetical protein